MTYALGRGVEYYDMPIVRNIVHDAEKDDYRFGTLILEVVKSDPFQMNSKSGPVPPSSRTSPSTVTASVRE
jgi:hypothetical protein